MFIRSTVAPDNTAAASLAAEVRELRKLATDRRAASLALFRDSAKHPTLGSTAAPALGGERVAA